jgi:hypothetical protein
LLPKPKALVDSAPIRLKVRDELSLVLLPRKGCIKDLFSGLEKDRECCCWSPGYFADADFFLSFSPALGAEDESTVTDLASAVV